MLKCICLWICAFCFAILLPIFIKLNLDAADVATWALMAVSIVVGLGFCYVAHQATCFPSFGWRRQDPET